MKEEKFAIAVRESRRRSLSTTVRKMGREYSADLLDYLATRK
jgi:hypothetical protein